MCTDECVGARLQIPNTDIYLFPGCKVKIGRFSAESWTIHFGWFSFGGNRPFCGWYMISDDNPECIRPVQLPDLTDIYLIKI